MLSMKIIIYNTYQIKDIGSQNKLIQIWKIYLNQRLISNKFYKKMLKKLR